MLGLPINASAHGHEIDQLILLVHLLMLVLFIGWGIFFVSALVQFNNKRSPKADYIGMRGHSSTWVEIAVAVVEIHMFAGLSIPFWAKQVNAFPNRKDTIEVRVIAEQFAWNIHYPGADGLFGKTDIKLIDKQSNPLGLDKDDPNGKDDFVTMNQLHLPIGRPAFIRLSSKDVVHSFSLNVMRVKQDAIPGTIIPLWFTPTKTGSFEIACAQLCGLGHYKMKGFLTIHSPESYAQWVEERAAEIKSDAEGGGDDFWN